MMQKSSPFFRRILKKTNKKQKRVMEQQLYEMWACSKYLTDTLEWCIVLRVYADPSSIIFVTSQRISLYVCF